MKILVLGATGETGRRVVRRLLRSNHTVRALCRDVARARAVLGDAPAIECVRGDVRDPASLAGLGRGADAAILAIGTRTYWGRNGGAAVDDLGTRNLCDALARDAIPHVVLLSAFGLDRRSPWLTLFSTAFNRYFHWKALAEAHVRATGVPYTIVRPVNFFDRATPRAPVLNQTEDLSLLRHVGREVVAQVLVHCAGNPEAFGKTFELVERETSPPLAEQLARMAVDGARRPPARTPLV